MLSIRFQYCRYTVDVSVSVIVFGLAAIYFGLHVRGYDDCRSGIANTRPGKWEKNRNRCEHGFEFRNKVSGRVIGKT